MEAIIDLHHNIMFIVVIIVFFVLYILFRTLLLFFFFNLAKRGRKLRFHWYHNYTANTQLEQI